MKKLFLLIGLVVFLTPSFVLSQSNFTGHSFLETCSEMMLKREGELTKKDFDGFVCRGYIDGVVDTTRSLTKGQNKFCLPYEMIKKELYNNIFHNLKYNEEVVSLLDTEAELLIYYILILSYPCND